MPKTICQTQIFRASPHEVYEALMDSHKHRQFTGEKANISRKIGGRFTAYGGDIAGDNLELVPNQKIVQGWKCTATGWPENHYSKLTITLEAHQGGTKLTLNHEDVPDEAYEECTLGWQEAYWNRMRQIFGW